MISSLIVFCIVAVILCIVVYIITTVVPMGPPVPQVLWGAVAIVLLLLLLRQLGLAGL